MKKLILMVGLPRSGKTTKAQTLGFPIVNPDSIRLAFHGNRFISDAEPMVWTMAKYMVKSLFLAGHDVVVVDATNTTEKRRSFWVSGDWIVEFLHISTTKDVCIKRAMDLNDLEIIPIIEKMDADFDFFPSDELHP